MAASKIKINRAPVLTLWAAVVAERLGHDRAAALTLGKAVAGLNAQAKGRRLGIYEAPVEAEAQEKKSGKASKKKPALTTASVMVLGRPVPATHTEVGLRALGSGEPIDPESVERYLAGKFGGALADVRAALEELAGAYGPAALEQHAYALYEQFRPAVPEGTRGWGARGELDLNRIRALAKQQRRSTTTR